jgi:hypothetical protein
MEENCWVVNNSQNVLRTKFVPSKWNASTCIEDAQLIFHRRGEGQTGIITCIICNMVRGISLNVMWFVSRWVQNVTNFFGSDSRSFACTHPPGTVTNRRWAKMLRSMLRPMKHLCFLSLHDRGKTYTYRKWLSAQGKLRRLLVLQRFQWLKDGMDHPVKIFAPHQLTKNN